MLSNDQKKVRTDISHKLLSMLEMHAEHYFEGIATGDESWFHCSSYSDSIFAES
jgi:hypothetical protein